MIVTHKTFWRFFLSCQTFLFDDFVFLYLKVVTALADHLSIKCILCCGGKNNVGQMSKSLGQGYQIVVGTPGRILGIVCAPLLPLTRRAKFIPSPLTRLGLTQFKLPASQHVSALYSDIKGRSISLHWVLCFLRILTHLTSTFVECSLKCSPC